MNFEYNLLVIYDKISDEFDIVHGLTKVKVRHNFDIFSIYSIPNTVSAQSWKNFRHKSQEKTLLAGSSIIRDISETCLDNTDVACRPGGRINDITEIVKKTPLDKYNQIVLVAGGNNCDQHDQSTAETPSESNTFKLEKLQSKALRYIMLDFKSTYVGLLNKCKKYPLYIGRIHMMVFKIKNNMYPRYLDKFFKN